MKKLFFLILVLVACSKERPAITEPTQPEGTLEIGGNQVAEARNCALKFAQAGLCAEVVWDGALREEKAGGFQVTFWNEATGELVNPADAPTTVFVMKCCSTPYAFELKSQSLGVYRADVEGLPMGEYFHLLRLGSTEDSETLTADVVVE